MPAALPFLQVPGRQCLASAALLGPAPEDALPLLESLVEVCEGDNALMWNLGMARAAAGQWAGAVEALQQVQVRLRRGHKVGRGAEWTRQTSCVDACECRLHISCHIYLVPTAAPRPAG